MQAKQASLLREGRALIDQGLRVEETASARGLRDDPVSLDQARKQYPYSFFFSRPLLPPFSPFLYSPRV